jgi:hypothetical protein
MKQTDGLFHEVFNEIAKEYPEIETLNLPFIHASGLFTPSYVSKSIDGLVTTTSW